MTETSNNDIAPSQLGTKNLSSAQSTSSSLPPSGALKDSIESVEPMERVRLLVEPMESLVPLEPIELLDPLEPRERLEPMESISSKCCERLEPFEPRELLNPLSGSPWDSRYELEFANFREFGDEGEIWFGTSSENRIVKYLIDSKCPKNAKILDLGCGNGSVLRKLRSKGFTNLKGVDYCEAAVELSRGLCEKEQEEDEDIETEIAFERLDITNPDESFFDAELYDVILDKGTWDAMSLSDEKGSRLALYKKFLERAMKSENSKFIIFSCNFTVEELKCQFASSSPPPQIIQFLAEVPAVHTFSFGGQKGVTSTGAVFVKI